MRMRMRNLKSTLLKPDELRVELKLRPKLRALYTGFVHQFNAYSCSAAAVTTLLNGVRFLLGSQASQTLSTVLLSQKEVLTKVTTAHWQDRVSDAGYLGTHGMPLPELERVIEAALKTFQIPYQRVVSVRMYPGMQTLGNEKAQLEVLLEALERSPAEFMIAHFTQGEFYGNWYGGHISPVGAYDPKTRRVLVLDVDPECPGPYWIKFERFCEGLVGASKAYGVKGGGYVRIQLNSAELGDFYSACGNP